MTLFLRNEQVRPLLRPLDFVNTLDRAYRAYGAGNGVCAPRLEFQGPTNPQDETYQLAVSVGLADSGYGAIRIKSDMVFRRLIEGRSVKEKYCVEPGSFLGLILLFDTRSGALLAILQDGLIQKLRVGADSALGVRYLARADADVLGILGSGGMAATHLACIGAVRRLREIRVYSPTTAHRDSFVAEARNGGHNALAVDTPAEVFAGADMVAACTNAIGPVVPGELLEPGQHVTAIGGTLDEKASARIDIALRLGLADRPAEIPHWQVEEECLSFHGGRAKVAAGGTKRYAEIAPERRISLAELVRDPARGRSSPDQITFSERGNIHGLQFAAVAGLVYEQARAAGVGMDLGQRLFLEDIRN